MKLLIHLKNPWIVCCLLIFSAFGPYLWLSAGLRTDHVMIYPLFLWFYLVFCVRPQKIKFSLFVAMGIWLWMLLWMSLSTVFALADDPSRSWGLILSRFENVLQPLCLLFVMSQLTLDPGKANETLKKTIVLFLALLSLNTLWSLTGYFISTTAVNKWFWGGEYSVAFRSLSGQRYLGIINQPMESGMLYSLGFLGWAYLAGDSEKKSHFLWSLPLLGFLILGGVLSASKIFVGGALLFGVYLFLYHRVFLAAGMAALVAVLFCFQTKMRILFQYFYQKLTFSDLHSLWHNYFALRYSKESGNMEAIRFILDNEPWIGFGFGALQTVESAYTEMLAQGGLVCLALYFCLLLFLGIHSCFLLKNKETRRTGVFLLWITALITGAGLGGPIFTANRVSVVLCVLLGLLLRSAVSTAKGSACSRGEEQDKK